MRTAITLVRHGQTEANRTRRYQSFGNSPLTAYGEQQMAAVAHALRRQPISYLVSSPTSRTYELAALLLDQRPHLRIHVDPRWSETSHGDWEGLTYREVQRQLPGDAERRWADPLNGRAENGESLAETAARVASAWHELVQRQRGGRVVIVTHATPIKLVLCALFGLPPTSHWHWRIDLGTVTSIDLYPSGPILRMVNQHLPIQAEM